MVAFSNWPSSVQKVMRFWTGLDAFRVISFPAKAGGYLKDLQSRFQPYLKTAWSTSLTQQSDLELHATPFWREKHATCFSNHSNVLMRILLIYHIQWSSKKYKPNSLWPSSNPPAPFAQTPSIKPSASFASMAWSFVVIESESSINVHLVLSQNGRLHVQFHSCSRSSLRWRTPLHNAIRQFWASVRVYIALYNQSCLYNRCTWAAEVIWYKTQLTGCSYLVLPPNYDFLTNRGTPQYYSLFTQITSVAHISYIII